MPRLSVCLISNQFVIMPGLHPRRRVWFRFFIKLIPTPTGTQPVGVFLFWNGEGEMIVMKSMLRSVYWREHVALDVGTATTRIASGQSALSELPSSMGERRALREGVVVDGEAVARMLHPLFEGARRFGLLAPCVLACAPSDARQEERQMLTESILRAGAASVALIPEPLAAAIGAGMDVSSPYAQMVIDIGEGVTDCAIIRSGKIHATCATRIGCSQMRRAIVSAAKGYGCPFVSDSFADTLMRTCGLTPSRDEAGSVFTAAALRPVVKEIADTVDAFLRDLPHGVGCEVIDSGICLTGGGALIPGIREFFEQRTGIGMTIAGNPRSSVVEGARAIVPVILSLNQWR
jgi:rod shape-determining protein MreB